MRGIDNTVLSMCEGSLGARPQKKGVLGASEAPFRACTQYIHTGKLPSSIRGFRSKKSTIVWDPS